VSPDSAVHAAVIGATTFGAGLPAGEVTRVALDACVRFDGTIFVAEISGAELAAILAKSNQDPATPLSARRGENLVAVGPDLPLDPARRYRLATTDWGAKNARTYFGSETLGFVEQPNLRLKTLAAAALSVAATVVP
jgi:2',3'-cyclic-nucleotide 2'-phosphodiesterase (5'-nucleotidase family)